MANELSVKIESPKIKKNNKEVNTSDKKETIEEIRWRLVKQRYQTLIPKSKKETIEKDKPINKVEENNMNNLEEQNEKEIKNKEEENKEN